MKMKKIFLFLIATMFSFAVSAQTAMPADYEMVGVGVGKQSTYLVEVTVTVDKKDINNDNILKRCAVHGVLFRGITRTQKCQEQKPLAGSAMVETQHAEFFEPFFGQGGAAVNYGSVVAESRKVVKVNKKTYRITATVSVDKSLLQKDLREAGVIKKLDAGF